MAVGEERWKKEGKRRIMKWNVRGGAAVVCQPVTVRLPVCVCVVVLATY